MNTIVRRPCFCCSRPILTKGTVRNHHGNDVLMHKRCAKYYDRGEDVPNPARETPHTDHVLAEDA